MDVVRKTKCAHKVNQTFSSVLFTMAGLQGKITGQTKKLENVTHTQGKTKKKKRKKKVFIGNCTWEGPEIWFKRKRYQSNYYKYVQSEGKM